MSQLENSHRPPGIKVSGTFIHHLICRNGDVPENQIIKEKNNFLYMAGSLLRATQVFYHEKLRTVLWNIYIFAPVCR